MNLPKPMAIKVEQMLAKIIFRSEFKDFFKISLSCYSDKKKF